MRVRTGSLLSLVLLSFASCGGGSPAPADGGGRADSGGLDGGGTGACAGAADGAECGSMAICVAGACVASTCGDGVTDARTEECDDANDMAFDGCEPVTCAFTCTEATSASCDDANPCNGAESCALETHRCSEGMPLEDGAACTLEGAAGVCGAGECRMPGCHNGVLETGEDCDDGNDDETDGCRSDCTFTCATDDDCAGVTGTVCDGDETCDASHVCRPGTELAAIYRKLGVGSRAELAARLRRAAPGPRAGGS